MNRRRRLLFEYFHFGYRLKSIFRVGVWFGSGSSARNHCLTNRLKGRKLLRSLYPRFARRPLAQALCAQLVIKVVSNQRRLSSLEIKRLSFQGLPTKTKFAETTKPSNVGSPTERRFLFYYQYHTKGGSNNPVISMKMATI